MNFMQLSSTSRKALLSIGIVCLSLFSSLSSAFSVTAPDLYFGAPYDLTVKLYAEDQDGNPIKDPTNPGQYELNQFIIDLGAVSDDSLGFIYEPIDLTGMKWTLPKTIWKVTANFQDPANPCIFSSPANSYRARDPETGLVKLLCPFTTRNAGHFPAQCQIRVTSSKNPNYSGTIDDRSDEVAYTMTIIVVDNTPKSKPAPSSPADTTPTDNSPSQANRPTGN